MLVYLLSTICLLSTKKIFFRTRFVILHMYLFVLTSFLHLLQQFLYCVEKVRCAVKIEFLFLILNRIKYVVKHLKTDRDGGFAGSAHCRLKWAVCMWPSM